MFGRRPKCLLIGGPCPRNSDPAKGSYCPKWWRESWKDDVTGKVEVREACSEELLGAHLASLNQLIGRLVEETSEVRGDARSIIERKLDEALAPMPAFVRQVVQRMALAPMSYSDGKMSVYLDNQPAQMELKDADPNPQIRRHDAKDSAA